jgi:hypothetical protein
VPLQHFFAIAADTPPFSVSAALLPAPPSLLMRRTRFVYAYVVSRFDTAFRLPAECGDEQHGIRHAELQPSRQRAFSTSPPSLYHMLRAFASVSIRPRYHAEKRHIPAGTADAQHFIYIE